MVAPPCFPVAPVMRITFLDSLSVDEVDMATVVDYEGAAEFVELNYKVKRCIAEQNTRELFEYQTIEPRSEVI